MRESLITKAASVESGLNRQSRHSGELFWFCGVCLSAFVQPIGAGKHLFYIRCAKQHKSSDSTGIILL